MSRPKAVAQNRTLEDLKNLVIDLLTDFGMNEFSARDFVSISPTSKTITINPDCANSDYTLALAMFMLLFSEDNEHGYLSFGKVGNFIRVHVEPSEIDQCCQYLIDHSEVSVEF